MTITNTGHKSATGFLRRLRDTRVLKQQCSHQTSVVPSKHGNRKWQYHQSACPELHVSLRLLQSRLGCMLEEPNSKWSVVSSGSQKAYKCSQTESSLSCHQSLSQRPVQQESVSPHGQHHSSCPHHNKGVTRSPQLVNLILKLLQWCLQKSILSTAQHLTGKHTDSQESFTTPAKGK